MGIRNYKPTSPGRRFVTSLDFSEVTTSKPLKKLTKGKKRSSGRNNEGHVTSRHRGGGHKRRYRVIDMVVAGEKVDVRKGNAMPLRSIPLGTQVHNVELKPGKGGQVVRSAGASAQIMAKEGKYATLRMPSGEMRMVLASCMATIGQVGNSEQSNLSVGKAGRSRWKGIRPQTRGTAMNPVDHPHGGGEGRNKGRHPVTPWGKPTKGAKTRGRKSSDRLIVSRRKK